MCELCDNRPSDESFELDTFIVERITTNVIKTQYKIHAADVQEALIEVHKNNGFELDETILDCIDVQMPVFQDHNKKRWTLNNEFELIEEPLPKGGTRKVVFACGVDDGELKLSREVAELLVKQGNGYILEYPESIDNSNLIDDDISRDDPKLISAIEAVGIHNACGSKSQFGSERIIIKIVEIPNHVQWQVCRNVAKECEQIEEVHRVWR